MSDRKKKSQIDAEIRTDCGGLRSGEEIHEGGGLRSGVENTESGRPEGAFSESIRTESGGLRSGEGSAEKASSEKSSETETVAAKGARSGRKKLKWMRLDNAALIFPAALRKNWSNAFRISFSFRDLVEPDVLAQALRSIAPRFPTVVVRLKRSLFWYYIEELPEPPGIGADSDMPLCGMTRRDLGRSAIRVLYYRDRMAVEYFHAVTDGTGGMIFAKNLAAEYVRLRYGAGVPCEFDVKDLSAKAPESEFKDRFPDNAGSVAFPREKGPVFRFKGDKEPDLFLHVTKGVLDAEHVLRVAREKGVTVTEYLTAVLVESIIAIQSRKIRDRRRQKKVKVQIPVNLRKLYNADTMRNFVAVASVGVDPRMGDYTFDELLKLIHHQLQISLNPKNMAAVFKQNVLDEQNPLVKPVPLFIKNIVMRMVFDRVGESAACLSFSNLGAIMLPDAMKDYVTDVEFILGAQADSPYNTSLTTYGGKLNFNMVRNTVEPVLEREFFTRLVKLGFHVKIDGNFR